MKKKKPIKIKQKSTKVTSLDSSLNNDYVLSRWAALLDAVDLIFEHSIDKHRKFKDLNLKPLAIQKYIDNKSDEIMNRLLRQKSKNESR